MAALALYIIGAPGAGKSSVFDALTTTPEGTTFTTRRPHRVASVKVPDDRLERLRDLYHPKKYTPAEITFLDVGLPLIGADSLKGVREMLGDADAFVVVLQAFDDGGGMDPQAQMDNLLAELILADLDLVETRLERIAKENIHKKQAPQGEKELLERCRTHLESEQMLRDLPLREEEDRLLKSLRLLSRKTIIMVDNVSEDNLEGGGMTSLTEFAAARGLELICFCAPLEAELARLPEEERKVFLADYGITISARPRLIQTAYRSLNLISFFTVGEDEVRAWTLPRGETALQAGGKIHTDIQRGFIRAEVVTSEALLATGSLSACRDNATLRLEGKTYPVQDGEVMHFRFSV